MMKSTKCFACDRKITGAPLLADTKDEQIVHVGPECMKKILKAEPNGYQPPKGGPRLYRMTAERFEYFEKHFRSEMAETISAHDGQKMKGQEK